MISTKSKPLKYIAVFIALNILLETVLPTIAFALTSGPKSPEFMSFTPVATTNMVDLVTGDFNYNIPVIEIPGADGGGYSLSLAYNSGINSEQEASWVGFGWNLSPGALDRNLRGFPDDYCESEVTYFNKATPNWSIMQTSRVGVGYSKNEKFGLDLGLSVSNSTRFNNHQGFYNTYGFGLNAYGLSGNLTYNTDQQVFEGITFSANIDFMKKIKKDKLKVINELGKEISNLQEAKKNDQAKVKIESLNKKVKALKRRNKLSNVSTSFGVHSFADATRSTSFSKYKGFSVNLRATLQTNSLPIPVGAEGGYYRHFNIQLNERKSQLNAYGFLHSPSSSKSNYVMDYYTEKEGSYNRRDLFIGMPFSNADIFQVTGDGLSGGFRAYNNKFNFFKPSSYGDGSNKLPVYNAGIEFMVGTNIGIGLSLGYGYTKTQQENWGKNFVSSSNAFFRFNNDLGGKIVYDDYSSDFITAKVNCAVPIPGLKWASLSLSETDIENLNLKEESSYSSSYISFNTLEDIKTSPDKAFSKNHNPNEYQNKGLRDKSIVEFSIYNNSGSNFVYAQPIFTRNESNLTFDISPSHDVINNYLAFRETPLGKKSNNEYDISTDDIGNNRTLVGEIRKNPYATTYLLSHILESNFIDRKNDGPTEDDFGGWTKFSYNQIYGGSSDSWYRYRTPYAGLHYNQGSISDNRDATGSVSTGEKEVYYLETIETKTHIAFFVTNNYKHNKEKYGAYNVKNGSKTMRLDGLDAIDLNEENDPASESLDNKGDNELEYLERIVLFSKARPDQPIKTICFEYDWSLVPGIPNSNGSGESTGKLTLKKLWYEYEGKVPAKISPYEFSYQYAKSANVNSGKEFFTEYDDLSTGQGSSQNPSYSPWLLDVWGNVMAFGEERKNDQNNWVYQGINPKFNPTAETSWRSRIQDDVDVDFDPASWHLKSVKLPSGGEIHIQYEQKNYKFVQDRPAMAMASLVDHQHDNKKFIIDINVDDLGCDPTDENQVNELKEIISDYFKSQREDGQGDDIYAKKLYFKFLFDLIGNNPSLTNPTSEYIDGYSEIVEVDIVSKQNKSRNTFYAIRIKLGSKSSADGDRTVTPNQGALDFYYTQRNGLFTPTPLTTKVAEFDMNLDEIYHREGTTLSRVKNIVKFLMSTKNLITQSHFAETNNKRELSISNTLSYVKLPIYGNKRGGGVRVKRLLMYDTGIENGASRVLGQSYHYVLEDGTTSSGVATNEPYPAREENPLVEYMVREGQKRWNQLSVGEDKKQTEGPLGESLLPPPAVYHSRVIVENIHAEKVSTGFTVHEFFTTKDYPFDKFYGEQNFPDYDGESIPSDFKGSGIEYSKLSDNAEVDAIPPINTPFFSYSMGGIWLAQGFRFVLNSMNGLSKSVTSYGGKYVKPNGENSFIDTDNGYLVSANYFEYFEPGEKVPLLKRTNEGFEIVSDTPGKEEEISVEKKQIKTKTFDISIDFDFSMSYVGIPLTFVTIVPTLTLGNESISTHATTRVLRYPAILKSQTVFMDGMYSKTENLVFSSSTGDPLITKAYDGYNRKVDNVHDLGKYYNFDVPAEMFAQYQDMGQKSKDPNNSNQLNAMALRINTYGQKPQADWLNNLDESIENTISASVTTYSKDWTWDDHQTQSAYGELTNDDMIKLNSKWRQKSNYVYKSNDVVSLPDNPVYASGTYTIENLFDFSSSNNNSWLRLNETTKYSPNGQPVEQFDVMNNPSAVIYGKHYGNVLPIMIAQNSRYSDIYFDDFEGDINANSSLAHSGSYSMLVYNGYNIISDFSVSTNLSQKGGILKLWLTTENPTEAINPTLNVNGSLLPLEKIAQTGLWTLFECDIEAENLNKGDLIIAIQDLPENNMVFVDDIRLQPQDASAICYVYDIQTLKLLTQFDDQHFGLYYVYNEEGNLTHKQIETERGLKTIQETQYNIPKVLR